MHSLISELYDGIPAQHTESLAVVVVSNRYSGPSVAQDGRIKKRDPPLIILLWLSDHKDLIILVCDLKRAVKAIAAQQGVFKAEMYYFLNMCSSPFWFFIPGNFFLL